MEIKCIGPSEDTLIENDYKDYFRVLINGEEKLFLIEGEPEDNTLSRNFNDVWTIPDLLKLAYDAGRNGEFFNCINMEE